MVAKKSYQQDPRNRILENISEEGGCWEWNKSRLPQGYGTVTVDSKTWRAHRYSFYIFNGYLDPDLAVMHTCDNPPCVNPDHLRQGTRQDNSNDMKAKGRSRARYNRENDARGSKHGRSKLTEEDVVEIRGMFETKNDVEIGTLFGVSKTTIRKIRIGGTWAWM